MTTGWIFRLRNFEKYENIQVESPKEEAVIFILPSRKEKTEEEKEEEETDDEDEKGGKDGVGKEDGKKCKKDTSNTSPPRQQQPQQPQQPRFSIYQPLKEDVLDESDVMLGTPLIFPSSGAENAGNVDGTGFDAINYPLSPVGGGGGGGGGGRHGRRHQAAGGVGGMARIPLLARAAGGGRIQGYQV